MTFPNPTRLAASSVAPFVLKELMRHNTLQQSGNFPIDATHLPLAAAVAGLPKFGLIDAQNGTSSSAVTAMLNS